VEKEKELKRVKGVEKGGVLLPFVLPSRPMHHVPAVVTHHPPSLPPSHSVIGLSAAKMEELNLFRGDTVLVKGKKGRWIREGGREGREGGREGCQ